MVRFFFLLDCQGFQTGMQHRWNVLKRRVEDAKALYKKNMKLAFRSIDKKTQADICKIVDVKAGDDKMKALIEESEKKKKDLARLSMLKTNEEIKKIHDQFIVRINALPPVLLSRPPANQTRGSPLF